MPNATYKYTTEPGTVLLVSNPRASKYIGLSFDTDDEGTEWYGIKHLQLCQEYCAEVEDGSYIENDEPTLYPTKRSVKVTRAEAEAIVEKFNQLFTTRGLTRREVRGRWIPTGTFQLVVVNDQEERFLAISKTRMDDLVYYDLRHMYIDHAYTKFMEEAEGTWKASKPNVLCSTRGIHLLDTDMKVVVNAWRNYLFPDSHGGESSNSVHLPAGGPTVVTPQPLSAQPFIVHQPQAVMGNPHQSQPT